MRCSAALKAAASTRAMVFRLSLPLMCRRHAGFKSDQQLAHGGAEGVGEPAFAPVRNDETRVAFACVAHCRRGREGILAPADLPDSHAVQAFDPPLDADVAGTSFLGGAGPDIVDHHAAKAAFIFQNRGADSVGMGNFVRGSGRVLVKTRSGSPNQERMQSRW